MKFKEFIGSGPMGIVAGTVTVLLGVGAVAALAFGSSAPDQKPMGDARLSSGGQAFEAALVANAGANDLGSVRRSGSDMADGSPVAGPASPAGSGAAAAVVANGDGGSGRQSRSAAADGAEAMRPGSAAYYKSLLGAGSVGGMGTLAMLSRGRSGGNVAGNLGRSGAPGLVRDDAGAVGNPLAPSRAFSSYGANDAGSSSVKRGGQAAVGTSPVGPSANNGASAGRSTPAVNGPPVNIPAAAPSAKAPASPPASSNVPSGVLQSTPAPSATDPLGEHAAPAPGGNPAAPHVPPVTAVVGPNAVLTPEPGTWLLVGSGLLALGLIGRRRVGQEG
jgi:hypothetical protein